jgi:hypothetical protein
MEYCIFRVVKYSILAVGKIINFMVLVHYTTNSPYKLMHQSITRTLMQ